MNALTATSKGAATREAIAETLAALRDRPVSEDELQRARQPMIEARENALKSNFGWLSLVDRAQTEPDRIDRYLKGNDRLRALTIFDIQAVAQRYLGADKAVEVVVLPEGVTEPRPAASATPRAAPPAVAPAVTP